MTRAVAIIDGEHYAPVVKDALGALRHDVAAVVVAGGTEKLRGDADYGVPVVETLEPAGPWDEDWEEPPPAPRRGRSRRLLVAAIVSLVALALVAGAGLWALSRSHFVGAESDGRIAVYQGFPYELSAGIKLYRTVYVSRILAGQLSQAERRRLFDHDLISFGDARRKVRALEAEVVP